MVKHHPFDQDLHHLLAQHSPTFISSALSNIHRISPQCHTTDYHSVPSITWRYPPDQHSPASIRSSFRAIHQISIQQHLQDRFSVLSYRLPLGAIHHLAISNKSALSCVHPVSSTCHPAGHHKAPTNRAAHNIRPPFGPWRHLTEQCTVTATAIRPPLGTWCHLTDRLRQQQPSDHHSAHDLSAV